MGRIRRRLELSRRARGDEAGFTLIELLVVVVVLPLLMGGLAALIVTMFQNTAPKDAHGTATQLADSHDAQLSSAYFVRDIQGAAYVSTSPAPLCAATGASGGQLLGLQWTSGSQTVDVSYFARTSPPALLRYYCVSPSAPVYPVTASAVNTIPVAPNVFSKLTSITVGACPTTAGAFGTGATTCATAGGAAYVAVTVSCYNGACPASPNPGMPAAPTTPGGTGVATVTLQVQESLSAYQYTLTAAPRASNSTTGGVTPPPLNPPFIANGGLSVGNCDLLVNGLTAVNDPNAGAVSFGPGGSDSTTGIYTTSSTPTSSVTGSGTYPTPVQSGNPVPSPYDSLTEPPTVPAGASYPIVTKTATNWDPSTDPTVQTGGFLNPATYPHGAIFVVKNGMAISKGFSAPQGVLFYVTGGNVSLNGNGNLSLNDLSPSFESPTQPTPEVVVWMSKSDTSPSNPPTLTLGGNGNSTLISGAIYAPTAAVTMNGGGSSGGVSAQSLDIGSLASCNGGGAVPYNITVGSTLSSGTTISPHLASITTGAADTVNITVQGVGALAPTGTVKVYECGPTLPSDGCGQTSGWTPIDSGNPGANQVGNPVTLTPTANEGVSTATSAPFTPAGPGTYCFAAYYSGDGSYGSSSDSTSDGCFTVSGPPAPGVTSPASGCYKTSATGGCLAWPGAITGTATDPGGPGLESVAVAVQGPSGSWWDPGTGSFSASSAVNIPVTDTSGNGSWSSWTLNFPSTNISGGGTNKSYTIVATSTDKAGVSGLSGSVSITWK